MQTTLLGLAVAFIVALIAALIGPYFIDWNQLRPQFEVEAARVIGAPVRVEGMLDARFLPTPSLRLRSVSVGGANDPSKLRAERLDVEFSLGALMRGEWRASELSIDGLALDLGLDRQGRIDWPSSTGRFNLGSLAIDRFNLTGRIALHDVASGSNFQINNLAFSGDVRALAGIMRGEGSFTLSDMRIPFRVSTGQSVDGKGTRVRFTTEPGERAPATDLDGVLAFDALAPRFEGTVTLARQVNGPNSGRPYSGVPWRVSSKVKASAALATCEQIEVGYGPDESAMKLTGAADFRFGASPSLHAIFAARQLDGDRFLGHEAGSGQNLRLLTELRQLVTLLPSAPLPTHIELSAEQIMLGDRAIQNLVLDIRGDKVAWKIEKFELRAPGATRVTANGVIAQPGPDANFAGPVAIESADPELLITWLRGRSDIVLRNQKPLKLKGNATIAADRMAIEKFKAEFNGSTIEGRIALASIVNAGSRFEATLKTNEFDFDAAAPLMQAFAKPQADWPHEAQFSFEIGRAKLAGQDVRPVRMQFNYGPETIALKRLQIGSGNNSVAIDGSGSFDRIAMTGHLALSASLISLSQIGSFIEPVSPLVAARLNAVPRMLGAVRLKLSADIGQKLDHSDRLNARAILDIDAPQLKGALIVRASPEGRAARGLDWNAFSRSEINLETRLSSNDSRLSLALLGLDRVVAAGEGAAQLDAAVTGAWRTPLQLQAKLTGAGFDMAVQGTGEPWAEKPKADLNLTVRQGDLTALFGLKPMSVPGLNVSLSSRLAIDGRNYTFENIDSIMSGARVRGRLSVMHGDETGIDGAVDMDVLDLAPVTSLVIGAAGHAAAEPLTRGFLQGWRGRVSFQAQRGVLPGGTELQSLGGVIKNDGQSLVFENLKGRIGGGEAIADIDARRNAGNTTINTRVQLSNVDGAALRYRELSMPGGRASLQMTLVSQGRSAAALTGAISGTGSWRFEDSRIKGLDAGVFDAAKRAGDAGQISNESKLKDTLEPVLAGGAFSVPSMQVPFSLKDGRLRVDTTTLNATDARAVVAGGYDLAADQIDIRTVLSSVSTDISANMPEITLYLYGSPDKLNRSLDVAALSSWLAMRAIDREMRKLDQLEKGAPYEKGAASDDASISPSEMKIPHRDPRRVPPQKPLPRQPLVLTPPASGSPSSF